MAEMKMKETDDVTVVDILESVLVLHVDFDIWTGQSTLTESDMQSLNAGIAVKVLGNAEGTNGRKNLIDKETLKPFGAIRDGLKADLDKIGLRFCGGWAIPTAKRNKVRALVKEAQTAFETKSSEFVAEYPQNLNDWCASHPALEAGIRAAAPTQQQVREFFKVQSFLFPIGGVVPDEESEQERKELELALRGQFVLETARYGHKLFEDFCRSMPYGNATLLGHVVTLSHKVNGLTFLKPEMSKVWTVLEDMILKFGPDGRIEGGDFVRLAATMKILSTVDGILSFIDGKVTVDAVVPEVEPGVLAAVQTAGKLPDLLRSRNIKRRITPALVRALLEGNTTLDKLEKAATASARKVKSKPKPKRSTDSGQAPEEAILRTPGGRPQPRLAPAPAPKTVAPTQMQDPDDPLADLTALLNSI
mgnify:FL=1